jgi:hypothetical protein
MLFSIGFGVMGKFGTSKKTVLYFSRAPSLMKNGRQLTVKIEKLNKNHDNSQ